MKLKKIFQLALNILFHSKLRSWLTIIGIVIGIASVVAIVSISEGAQQSLEERLGQLGADVISVTPGMSRAKGAGFGGGDFHPDFGGEGSSTSSKTQKNLTAKDVMVLKNVENVLYVMGEVSGRADVSYSSKSATLSVQGIDVAVWKDITTDDINSGRLLTKGDTFSVVIGGNIAESVFENGVPLNSKLLIEGKSFKVVGILEEGSTIYMPIDIARTVLEDVGEEEFDDIKVKIENVDISDETVTAITEKLMFSRGILQDKNKDFGVSSPKEMQETMQATLNTMTLFLGAIAAISLIVGAVGIANTLFTSVLEKTREIGIMKAIGAQNKDVLLVFLFNSGLIGLVGGIGGIVLGYLTSTTISSLGGIQTATGGGGRGFMGAIGSSAVLSPELIIGVLLFSIIIGIISGVIPAYRASRLNPVDALRYE